MAHAQIDCETPTIYPTATRAEPTWTPLPSPTPFTYTIDTEDNPGVAAIIEADSQVVTITNTLTNITDMANSFIPYLSQMYTDTVIALPFVILREFTTNLPFILASITIAFGFMAWRFIWLGFLALIANNRKILEALEKFWKKIAPILENKAFWLALLAGLVLYACNEIV